MSFFFLFLLLLSSLTFYLPVFSFPSFTLLLHFKSNIRSAMFVLIGPIYNLCLDFNSSFSFSFFPLYSYQIILPYFSIHHLFPSFFLDSFHPVFFHLFLLLFIIITMSFLNLFHIILRTTTHFTNTNL